MAWEYLEKEAYRQRLIPIVSFLEGKTKDKIIIDLDCGTAPLVSELKPDWYIYFGNDHTTKFTDEAIMRKVKNTRFSYQQDHHIVENVEQCDILLCLGYGAGDLKPEPLESSTLRGSLIKIAKKCKPEFIIIEMIQPFEVEYGAMTMFKEQLPEYNCELQLIEINDDFEYVRKRLIGFFTLKPS